MDDFKDGLSMMVTDDRIKEVAQMLTKMPKTSSKLRINSSKKDIKDKRKLLKRQLNFRDKKKGLSKVI